MLKRKAYGTQFAVYSHVSRMLPEVSVLDAFCRPNSSRLVAVLLTGMVSSHPSELLGADCVRCFSADSVAGECSAKYFAQASIYPIEHLAGRPIA